MPRTASPLAAFAVACLGIALYAVMDAVMKGLGLALGAYTALFWRGLVVVALAGPAYFAGRPRAPARGVLVLHLARSAVVSVMAICFFWGITQIPLAEAIALSFIAPLIALGLAALFLKEAVERRSVLGAMIGLAGVAVILAGQPRAAQRGEDAWLGVVAVLVSAAFYAVNLVMARHQAQRAKPLEIGFYQNLFTLGFFALAAPWFLVMPEVAHWPAIAGAAALSLVSLLLMSWANARAEAQLLVTVEYTAFLWASLMGWLVFDERVTFATLGGAVLIVCGCLIALRRPTPSGGTPETEAALT